MFYNDHHRCCCCCCCCYFYWWCRVQRAHINVYINNNVKSEIQLVRTRPFNFASVSKLIWIWTVLKHTVRCILKMYALHIIHRRLCRRISTPRNNADNIFSVFTKHQNGCLCVYVLLHKFGAAAVAKIQMKLECARKILSKLNLPEYPSPLIYR